MERFVCHRDWPETIHKTKDPLVKHHDEAGGEMESRLPTAADVSGSTFCIPW